MTNASYQQNNIDLGDLYQEVILEHFKRPRFKSKPLHCHFCEEGKNPLCGDTITLYCQVNQDSADKSISTSFEGSGCSISQASASMMCDLLQNVSFDQAKDLIRKAEDIYTGKTALTEDEFDQDIQALHGVSKFPVRIKCAALAWKTMEWLLNHHFNENGEPKSGCQNKNDSEKSCLMGRTLKVVSTDKV